MNDPSKNYETHDASRRSFLKSSTAAAVGAGLAGLAIGRSAHAAGDDVIRIGLVGCGGRGTGAASQALHVKENVKLVAMADAFPEQIEKSLQNLLKSDIAERIDVSKEQQFTGLDAYQKLLASDVDVVILATPPGFRPWHFQAAVEAGKHIFMEKPVAVDAPGVRAVLAAAEEAKKKNLKVGVGLQRHHDPGYQETIARLRDGAIGDMVTARVYWNGAGVWVRPRQPEQTEMQYQVNNWYYFNWLSGDHIVEQHIHNLDVINWLKEAYPVSAQGMGGRQVRVGPEYGEIYDHHAVEFEYSDGSRMFSFCRHIPSCWNSVTEHVHGTKGYSDVSNNEILAKGASAWKYGGGGDRRGGSRRSGAANPYQIEHDVLFAKIVNDEPHNEAEYGAKSTMTSILGRMCTYSGQMITWDEAINSSIALAPNQFTSWQETPPVPAVAVPGHTQVV